MEQSISVSMPTDQDGFLSHECPSCRRRFRVVYGQGSDKPVSCCPYCSHRGTGCWWTAEQAEYVQGVLVQEVIAPKLDQMASRFNRNAGQGLVKMRMNVQHQPAALAPLETAESLPKFLFSCCNETIKHDGRSSLLNCVICGTTVSLA